MSSFIRRPWLQTLAGSVYVIAVTLAFSGTATAACPGTLPTSGGTATFSVSVPAATSYSFWTHLYSPGEPNDALYVRVDDKDCHIVGNAKIPVNQFTWVNYQEGDTANKITLTLGAGEHKIVLAGLDEGVAVDKVMLVADASCVPTDTGENCAKEPAAAQPSGTSTGPGDDTSNPDTTTSNKQSPAMNTVELVAAGTGSGLVLMALGIAALWFWRPQLLAKGIAGIKRRFKKRSPVLPARPAGYQADSQPIVVSDHTYQLPTRPAEAIIFAAAFALIGVVLLFTALAATQTSSYLVANATLTGKAVVVDKAEAIGGKMVRFSMTTGGAPATTGSTTPGKSPTGGSSSTPSTSNPTPPANSCPNAQHTPGGPDSYGGCWPYEGNTGVPAGTALTTYTGPCTITTANTVIDKKTVNCTLDIRAQNVTITKSKINGYLYIDDTRCNTASFSVTDSTIVVNDINYRGMMYCKFTATRVDVSGGASMAWCNSCTIQDSYLHNPLEDPQGAAANHGAHNSTVRVTKNVVLKHNTLWCYVKEYAQPDGQDTSGCSANQTGYSHESAGNTPENVLIERNLYMPTSGGYCAYGGSGGQYESLIHDIVFKDNIFKRNAFNGQGGPNCGFWGAVSGFDSNRPGNVWSNNRWDDGAILPPDN
jgi:hypothetical protein